MYFVPIFAVVLIGLLTKRVPAKVSQYDSDEINDQPLAKVHAATTIGCAGRVSHNVIIVCCPSAGNRRSMAIHTQATRQWLEKG